MVVRKELSGAVWRRVFFSLERVRYAKTTNTIIYYWAAGIRGVRKRDLGSNLTAAAKRCHHSHGERFYADQSLV